MYRWYQNSGICWAYLPDITSVPLDVTKDDFKRCKWFKRGWTLQELIAPRDVHFFNETWEKIGTKDDLAGLICDITRIDERVLSEYERDKWSVAQRMSWAAERITTRPEDRAYCLLGIFDINMPLLYGEGDKAFLRLQEEIIKQDDDHSIFAWQMASGMRTSGLLAPSPSCFLDAASIVVRPSRRAQKGFKMTNRGLSIFFDMTPFAVGTYLSFLQCSRRGPFGHRLGLAISLRL
ncbi:Vegetative incompatibility protein HET-E-1, partial [Cercospora beticola]